MKKWIIGGWAIALAARAALGAGLPADLEAETRAALAKGAAWLAAISFSLYLVHKPMYGVVQSQLGEWLEGRGIVAWLVYGVASLLAAALLYYAVERPGLRLRTRVLSRG